MGGVLARKPSELARGLGNFPMCHYRPLGEAQPVSLNTVRVRPSALSRGPGVSPRFMRIGTPTRRSYKLPQAAGCLACGVVSWRFGVLFAGTEFGGGQLARWNDIGGDLLLLALIGSFIFDRVAAGFALVACFLCLPMCLYFTVPRFLVLVFPYPWKMAPPHEFFIWDGWSTTGILAILLTVCLCFRRLLFRERLLLTASTKAIRFSVALWLAGAVSDSLPVRNDRQDLCIR